MWVIENIMVQWVHANPTFAYTIGMWKHEMPELIVCGMAYQQSGGTLNIIAHHMHHNGAFKVGDIDRDLFTSPTKFGAVSRREIADRMTAAVRNIIPADMPYGIPPLVDRLGALQVIWPDRRGIFPDEPGFSSEFAGAQPILA